jgi:hypothetical protein
MMGVDRYLLNKIANFLLDYFTLSTQELNNIAWFEFLEVRMLKNSDSKLPATNYFALPERNMVRDFNSSFSFSSYK